MKIGLLLKLGAGCDYHRLYLPFKYMTLSDGDNIKVFTQNHKFSHTDFDGLDVIIVNRLPAGISYHTLIEARDKYNFSIILDLDDYWLLYPEHHLYEHWENSAVASRTINFMEKVDMVWTTTDILAKEIGKYNKNVYVIPNGLPFGYEQYVSAPERETSPIFRLIYAGAASHLYDLKSIRHLLKKLGDDTSYRESSMFVLAGFNKNKDFGKGSEWGLIEKEVSVMRNYELKNILPLNKYMEAYNDADVAIAPLMSNKFNTMKSNLKIIEAGCKGIPIVCTKMFPFEMDASQNNKGVFLCGSSREWYATIKKLKRDVDYRKAAGEALKDYVRSKYNLLTINELRVGYMKLLC